MMRVAESPLEKSANARMLKVIGSCWAFQLNLTRVTMTNPNGLKSSTSEMLNVYSMLQETCKACLLCWRIDSQSWPLRSRRNTACLWSATLTRTRVMLWLRTVLSYFRLTDMQIKLWMMYFSLRCKPWKAQSLPMSKYSIAERKKSKREKLWSERDLLQ